MRLVALFFVIALGCAAARPKSTEGPRRALVTIEGMDVSGKILMEQASINSPVKIRGTIYGLEPGRHGLHIHSGSQLGYNCDSVGGQFIPEDKQETERSPSYLGNVKTFSGTPSRTEINLISSLVSLYDESPKSIIDRPLVIHDKADDFTRAARKSTPTLFAEDRLLACGLIRKTDTEQSIQLNLEKPYKVDKIEQSILNGEKTWENVRHPYYGASEEKVPSNLNLEGVERRDKDVDSLTLETTAPSRKIWATGFTYEYDYAGWTSTGIMGISTKVTGGSIKGRFVIEPVDESTLNVALLNTKAKQFNEDVMEKYSEVDPGQEVKIIDQEHLEKPFQIKILSGKVESVYINKEEPLWIVNFKRALAAQVQFQLDETSGVFQKEEHENYYAENTVYHALEGAPTGECQTWYHISPLPKEAIEAQPELLPVPELCENFPVYEIIKNRDLDSCRILPVFHYNSNQGYNCDLTNGAGCENQFSHTDVSRIIGCTNAQGHFLVQRVYSYDKYVTKPYSYETEATEGLTIQYFTLKSASPTGYSKLVARISHDVQVYQTLAYSYDDDYKTHGPLMGKPTLRESNSPLVMEVEPEALKKEAQRLYSEIVSELESEAYYADPANKHVADKINMLRRVFGYFDFPELQNFIEKVWESKEFSPKNQILVDALMLTGTNPSIFIVKDYILKGKISGEWAVQAISQFVPSVETPTKELFQSFYEFLKSDVVQNHRQLKITTALSVSQLIYQACVNTTLSLNMFPKLVMGEFCSASDSIVVNQLVPFFYEQIKNAEDAGERIAFLTALGNIGHEVIIPYIKPYITSCEPSSQRENEWYERNQRDLSGLSKRDMRKKWIEARKYVNKPASELQEDEMYNIRNTEEYEDQALCNIVRSKAIFALTNLAIEKKEVVSTLLMPVYFNKEEETEVRLSALTLLFIANPPQAFWNRVALSTWYEPNDQVAHFIYTTIASKVQNKDPQNREVTVRAEAALPLMKPFFWTSYVATSYFKAGYEEKTRLGYVFETTNFPGYESFWPSHHYNSLSVNVGPWYTKLYEYAIDAKHPEKFIDRLLGKPGLRFTQNKDESSIISPELQKIHEELKIEARATGQPELYIYLNFFDNYQRFYTINPNTVFKTIQKQILQKGFRDNAPSKFDFVYHKYLPTLDTFTRVPSAMGLAYSAVKHHSYFFSVKSQLEGSFSFSGFNAQFEGTFKPAFVKRMTYRLFVETPFAETYPTTGVDAESAVAFPGKYYFQADFKTGKVQFNWEILGDKLRVAKHSVIPFTTIRQIRDFTPALLLSQTKSISYMEEPKETKVTFGEKMFGLNFYYVQKSDALAQYQPLAYNEDLFGTIFFFQLPYTLRQREWSLYLDAASSETKTIKSYFSFTYKHDSKFETPLTGSLHAKKLFDTVFGEKIRSNKWVSEQDQEWSSQKFQHVFKSLSNPFGYSFDFNVEFSGKQSRRFGSSIAYGMDSLSHRGTIMMERRADVQSDEHNFVLCADFDAKYPEFLVFKRKEMIKEDYEPFSTFKIGFGKSCDDRKISINTKWARSEDQVTPNLRSKWQQTQCQKHEALGRGSSDECVAARRLNAYLNKAVTTIEYTEMPPFVYNATNKAINFFRHVYGPYMSDNVFNVQNQPNQITIESLYYPLAGVMDVKFYKPESNTFYHGVEVHPIAEVFLPKRMAVPRSVLAAPAVCLIGSETVTTFDGLLYNATFSGCDQVLTKDCSGRYQMAVLSREENNNKIVTVLLNNEKIEVFPTQQKVKVNGMDVSVSSESYVLKNSQNEILAIIKKTADNFIEVDSPTSHMIKVLVDSKEVVVMGSPIHRGRLCGLCGSQTGNKMTDLTGPRQCVIPSDLMDAAYELKSSPVGCKSQISSNDFSELRRTQEECLKERSESVWGISDVTPLLPKFQQNIYSSQITRRFPSQWTVYRNQMIVQDGKRCFSTEPVPKCAEGSQPVATEERKLGFHCVEKKVLSEELVEVMSRRPLDELMGQEIDTVRVLVVPTKCVAY